MVLYHGSSVAVRTPEIRPLVRALDFGRAFYLTSSEEQAMKWAKTATGVYTEEEAIRRLLPQHLRDQFAFKTERSLASLKFVESREVP